MNTAAYVLAFVSLLMGSLLFLHIQAPKGFVIWFPKLAAGALSPLWFIAGMAALILGLADQAPVAAAGGLIAASCMAWYIWAITRPNKEFDAAWLQFKQKIPSRRAAGLINGRWMGLRIEPDRSTTCRTPDIAFWTIPGTSRQLLCDIWQPAAGTQPSGLALLFFHGSAWYMLDKDFGTRPFFSHLVSQGHVVMDVAYRLCPEVDLVGMAGDVYRAVAWMKSNASRYGVNPEHIVLAGASAGGHLSQLAAYAPQDPRLIPEELRGADLSVQGVISLYGPCDLNAVYSHTNQQNLVGLPRVDTGPQAVGQKKNMRDAGRLDILLGGTPDEVPDMYSLASPTCNVHRRCPPTLLIQGQHDLITPISATRALFKKLKQCEVPSFNIEFPSTDHGFDLMLPAISPSYQSALYFIDRFLAMCEFLSNN